MCGRYGLSLGAEDLARVYQAIGDDIDGWTPHYSVAPSTTIPVLRARPDEDAGSPDGIRVLEPARWGFKPSWAKEKGPRPINARLETVATNGMFRNAMRSARCVVPMTGYYEWTEEGGKKVPHWIHADGRLLNAVSVAAASRTDDGWLVTVAIVTTTATDSAGQVHDRMPVFLDEDDLDEWLTPGKLDETGVNGLVSLAGEDAARIAGHLDTYRVDPRVNNVRRIDPSAPDLIEPVEDLFGI
ncbi:Putative SOS response-associated peptidase YedK [Acidipropionibacterium virtanenii]|uniref:Abasic site processing protein n=2 Tax=Acidipropionibacterium virtanenii TaxID=2057246 RepID=A0A344UQ46_9ACTN|nr:Putative SOS response-associated peptidase YedK [Acidipropionibacterium virtanenii]